MAFLRIFDEMSDGMKHTLLAFAILSMTLTGFAQDQIQLTNIEAEVYGYIDVAEDDEIEGHVTVVNATDAPMTIRVRRELLSTVDPWNSPYVEGEPGARERFCWGPLCYDYGQTETAEVDALMVTIEPGESDDSFYGYYEHRGVPGTTEIRYCFFNNDNEAVEVCQDIVFTVEQTQSVGELDTEAELGSVSPNPVNGGVASVAYDFNQRSGNERKFVVYNMVGSIVHEAPLNQPNGIVFFNTDKYQAGVYFYALIENGAVLQTKKFVVSK